MNTAPQDDRDSAPDGGADRPATAIQQLLALCLDRIESEGFGALEDMCARHPDEAAALREHVGRLKQVGLVLGPEGAAAALPERLGDYRLLRRLGVGGMGVVYLAEQESLRRPVALKLIRPEYLYFPGARERFVREVESVSRLRHPGIVPVHGCGEEGGVPYFAMEYVEGCTLADVLEELQDRDPRALTGADLARAVRRRCGRDEARDSASTQAFAAQSWVAASVRLVLDVAEALEHAHASGVLHRDVKPSNVMVTPEGRVRLLDFGLATSSGATKLTRTGATMGSLLYMAPEQVRGRNAQIDARTDVFALGAVLYEMLTLRAPFLHEDADEVRRRILEEEPESPRAYNSALPWDAETVCLAALEKDSARRYPDMAAFARDLRHVLDLTPIEAKRPSALLRTRRWTQRHPALSTAIALGFVLLVPAPLGFAWVKARDNRRIQTEKDAAENARAAADLRSAEARAAQEESDAVLAFQRRMLTSVNPGSDGRDVKVADVLDSASRELESAFAGKPALKAAVHGTIGDTYQALGLFPEADHHLSAAVVLLEQAGGAEASHLQQARANLATLRVEQGRFDEAEQLFATAVEALERAPGPDHPDTLQALLNFANLRRHQARLPDAEALARRAYEGYERSVGRGDARTIDARGVLAAIVYQRGELRTAEELLRLQVQDRTRLTRRDHPDTLVSMINLAGVLGTLDQDDEAIALAREVLEAQLRQLGEDHADTLTTMSLLATLLGHKGDLNEVEALERRVLEVRTRTLGPDHPSTLLTAGNLGNTLLALKRYVEAEALTRRAIEGREKVLGASHWETLANVQQLGHILYATGRDEEALACFRRAYEGARVGLGDDNWITAVFRSSLGSQLAGLGRFQEAETELTAAHGTLARLLGPDHSRARACANLLGDLYERWGDPIRRDAWTQRATANP